MQPRTVSLLGALGLGALLLASAPASPQDASPLDRPLGVARAPGAPAADCAPGVQDASGLTRCLPASSVGTLGHLYPLSQDLFVNSATGRVGVGTTFPFRTLEVVGSIGSAVQGGAPRVVARPSNDSTFGIVETVAGTLVQEVTNLVSSVSIDTTAGAIATVRGPEFLTALTTSAADSRSGYVTVRSQNVEVAGIDGSTGTVFGAAKAFVQPHPTDPTKEIRYVSLEGPENGVYFRGTLRLAGGEATIEPPESFRLVARAEGLTVSLTPLGPTRGLYVAEKTLERVVVRENPGGEGTASFDFLVMGSRAALPPHQAIADNVHFAPEPGTTVPEGRLPGAYRDLMVRNGTLNLDGSVNDASAVRLGWREDGGRWSTGPGAAAPVARD